MAAELPLDAAGIARRQFSTVRKGYDPSEVRAYLDELSGVVSRLQREEAHEHERADRAENRAVQAEKLDEHRLVELLGEETARVLEAARAAATDIRGKAEEAAARMVREAQVEARATTEQAERDGAARRAAILAEAEALRREAEDEVERCRVEGQVVADDLRRTAEAERDDILAEAERVRAEAAAAGEQIRATAREQGRRLVGEAYAVRERILGDLSRRRRTAREQLERLTGARERLLAAYEVVRRTVDEATRELSVALPEARVASAAAVQRVREEPDESIDMIEAEMSVARMSGQVDPSAAAVSDEELDAMLRELAEEQAAQEAAGRAGRAGDEATAGAGGPGAAEVDAGGQDDVGPGGTGEEAARIAGAPAADAPDDEGATSPSPPMRTMPSATDPATPEPATAGTTPPVPATDEVTTPRAPAARVTPPADIPGRPQSDAERWGVRLPRRSRGSRGRETPAAAPQAPARTDEGGAADPVAEPGAVVPVVGMPAVDGEGETGPYVDELFARIRAERGTEAVPPPVDGHDAEAGADVQVAVLPAVHADPTTDSDAEDLAGAEAPATVRPTADAAVEARSGPEADAAASGEATDEVDADSEVLDPVERTLRARDEVLAAVERAMGRRLKRVLADEQNEVLDTLRREGTIAFEDVLPVDDEHVDRYAVVAGPDLDRAAEQGSTAGGGSASPSCDALAGALGQALVAPLRERVRRSFDDADGDAEEVGERVRALYREWKGQRIGAAVRHYTAAAYSVGMAGAVPEGEARRWLVDGSCHSCPDCDDNALAGEVPGGEPFPTGDTRAPAHVDCRCLVVAVSALGHG
jgi:DivIVA domain-containing protein